MNGWQVNKGGSLILGEPKGDGVFKDICKKVSYKKDKDNLPSKFKGAAVKIKRLVRYTWMNGENNVYAVIDVNEDKYYLQLNEAIATGELKIPDGYSKKPSVTKDNKGNIIMDRHTVDILIDSIPLKDGDIFYDKIITAPGVKKDELFIRIRQWFVENFNSPGSVLGVNDEVNGLLTGNGAYEYSDEAALYGASHDGYIHFVINIAVKDGKFRVQIYNFVAKGERSFLGFLETVPSVTEEEYNMNDIYAAYKEGKRGKKYTRLYMESMVKLAFYIEYSLAEISKPKYDAISDF